MDTDNQRLTNAATARAYLRGVAEKISGASHTNEHGFGGALSLAALWRTETPWLFQLRSNWVMGFGKIDTVSALAGIGYQLDTPKPLQSPDAATEQMEKTTGNEITRRCP